MDNSSLTWDNSSLTMNSTTASWSNSSLALEDNLEETKLPPWFLVLNLIVRTLEGILALLGNSLTVIAISRFEFLQTTSNIFIAGLAAADIMGGLGPIWILGQYALHAHFAAWHVFCVIEQALGITTSFLNITIIGLIAIERCIYISYPLRYPSLVTIRVAMGALVSSSVINVAQVMITLALGIGRREEMTCSSRNVFIAPGFKLLTQVLFIVFTTIIVVMYSRIACIARYQANRVEEAQQSADHQMKKKAEYKVTKMMVIVLGFYFICFLPHMLFLAVVGEMAYQPVYIIILERMLTWVWWMSSWVNPLIYAWKSKAFARGFRLLLHIKPGPAETLNETAPTT